MRCGQMRPLLLHPTAAADKPLLTLLLLLQPPPAAAAAACSHCFRLPLLHRLCRCAAAAEFNLQIGAALRTLVPSCRMMMPPALTGWPPYTFTPRRLDTESRPF